MTNTATWMWFGNRLQFIAAPGSPMTAAEARILTGYTATGSGKLALVKLKGELRQINTPKTGRTTAHSTTYNQNAAGPSPFSYRPPDSNGMINTRVPVFLRMITA